MNELTQTLFRFVSMRAPQLSEEEGKEDRFIYYPEDDTEESNFYTAIADKTAGETKKSALKKAAQSFTPLTKQEIKDIAPRLFNYAEWLARNRATYNASEVWEYLNELTPLNDTFTTLWDNLFYQIITQKDFYAKEAIIQFLVANHVLNNYNREEIGEVASAEELEAQRRTILNTLLYAKVVLPATLFDEDALESTEEVPPDIKVIYMAAPQHVEKKIKADVASFKLKQLQHAKKELEQLKVAYKQDYKKEYQTQEKAHNELIKPILNKYQQQLKENKVGEETSAIEYPELPEFEFTFRPEIDAKTAKEQLSKTTQRVLSALQPLDKINSFKNAEKLFAKKEQELTKTVLKSKTFTKKSVSVNGTIMPFSTDIPVGDGFQYVLAIQAETTGLDDWTWEYYLNLTSQTENVAIQGITYGLSFDNGEEGASGIAYHVINTVGTSLIQVQLFSDLLVLQLNSDFGIPTISGTIHLVNGDTLDFSYKVNPDATIIIPYPYEEEGEEGGGGEDGGEGGLGEEEEEEGDDSTANAFTPSGYGMRQLGIADYRKVEQSVHCYIEGEVSHIENVMAREYKEKSSRRLRRSENTVSSTSETEKERLTDTTTTDRFEMQNEVTQVLAESQDFSAYANLNYDKKPFALNTGANYASHTSKEDSIFQAVTQAQEITARAMDRVVQKVKEERITKIIEEFEENNKHGFDNRKGSKHVIGVYRWVDKIYKNQIYNYGKRLMYEFVIPQPSKLHRLALTEIADSDTTTILEEPIDPRTLDLEDADALLESNYQYWAAMYNAEVNAPSDEFVWVSKSFSDNGNSGNYLTAHFHPGANHFSVEIPENYRAVSYEGRLGYTYIPVELEQVGRVALSIGGNRHRLNYGEVRRRYENLYFSNSLSGSQQSVGIGFHGGDVGGISISVEIQCERTQQSFEQWRNETFNAIIVAYEDKLAEYHAQKQQEETKAETLREANPLFYRQIEQTVLRKNCISYMIDQNTEATNTYGQPMYNGDTLENYEVNVDQKLDNYASFAQFIEQAFEWEIMSYKFYPFYWGKREEWKDLYQYENNDPLYRSFMQAGLARVVVTVRPGFEDAVMHYMATGNVWNGGLLPVLEDPLYLAIVDELQAPKGEKEGEAWKTRVPTSLTILQADSIGLKVEKALPCNCDDIADFQESDQTPCSSEIENDETIFENLQVGDGEVEEEEGGGVGEEVVILPKGKIKPKR